MDIVKDSKIHSIMGRIEVSDPASGIAVFKDSSNGIFAVFANTARTNYWIRNEHKNRRYLGTFDKTFNPTTVRRELEA